MIPRSRAHFRATTGAFAFLHSAIECNRDCKTRRGLQEPGYRNYISPRVGFWVPTTRTVRTKPEVARWRSSSASVCFSYLPGVDSSESNGSSTSPSLQNTACPGGDAHRCVARPPAAGFVGFDRSRRRPVAFRWNGNGRSERSSPTASGTCRRHGPDWWRHDRSGNTTFQRRRPDQHRAAQPTD
jgi:hypothetical protein